MIVDARGRLFGIINLLDAAVGIVVLLLIPLAFVSYRVFRTPAPIVIGVEPKTQDWKALDGRIQVRGEHLRQFLVSYVSKTGEPFVIDNRVPNDKVARIVTVTPTVMELALPAVEPGTYDLYLFDEGRQIAHRAAAFTLAVPAAKTFLTVVLRAIVAPELEPLIHAGDEDRFTSPAVIPGMPNATVVAVAARAEAASRIEVFPSPDKTIWLGGTEPGRSLSVTLRVPATGGNADRWEYKGQRLVPGESLTFETARYVLRGTILSMTNAGSDAGETRGQ